MKNIRLSLLLIAVFLFMSLGFCAFGAHQLYADIDGVTLPYGTKFELSMAQNVLSRQAAEGDMFDAYLTKDIYINNKLILPSKTLFRGRISGVKYSKCFSRPASLYLHLDHLVTKKGVQVPVKSGLSSSFEYILKSDGALTTDGNYFKAVRRDTKNAGAIVKRTVDWGLTSDDDLFRGAKYVFVPIAAVGGSVACACSTVYNVVADLFRHGDEVLIKKDAVFEIILLGQLEIPS